MFINQRLPNGFFLFFLSSDKVEITFIRAPAKGTIPLIINTGQIAVNAVIAVTECGCQFFAVQQSTIFVIRALQHIHPQPLAAGFIELCMESGLFVKRSEYII